MALTVVAFAIMLQFSAHVQASTSTDCAGEDANVLLQSKATVAKEMKLAMGPQSEEYRNVPSQADALLQSVLGMARADKNSSQLQVIKTAVNTLMPALTDAHAFAQTQLDDFKQEVDDCLSDTDAGLAIVVTKEDKVSKAEATHRQCRFEEKTKKTSMNDDCEALKSFVDTSIWQPIPTQRGIDTLRLAADEYDTLIIRLRRLDTACNVSTAAHVGQKTTCDGGQATFESHFCEYRLELADLKPRSDKCYSDKKAKYDDISEVMIGKVLKWKAEYKALKKILCYLDVWLGDGNHSTVNADVATQCQDDKIDTTAMDIVYPVVPPPTNVDVGPIAEYPGTDGWLNRYQGLPPHNSEVVPCIPTTTTTTTTTTIAEQAAIPLYTKIPNRIGCHSNQVNLGFIGRPKDILPGYTSDCKSGGEECVTKGKESCEYLIQQGSNCIGFAVHVGWGVQVYNSAAINRGKCNNDDGLFTNSAWDVYLRDAVQAATQSSTNVAISRPVTASSHAGYGQIAQATDGVTAKNDLGTGCAHTNSEHNAWIEVNLENDYHLSHAVIWNAWDHCCRTRINPFVLILYNTDHQEVYRSSAQTMDDSIVHEAKRIDIAYGGQVRYIKVQLDGHKDYLHVAEIQAFQAR